MVGTSLGIVDSQAFREALQKARRGHEVSIVAVMRTVGLEHWLSAVRGHDTAHRGAAALVLGALSVDAKKSLTERLL
jgi:hypothetical protein